MVLGGLVIAGCKKGDDANKAASTKGQESSATKTEPGKPTESGTSATPSASGDATAKAGVEAGGIQRDASEGPAAVLTAMTGDVQIRRVGEAEFTAAKADDKLYPGDQVRTGDKATATIGLADESVAEVAEVSTVAIASREGTADPGSSAAVLSGLARFTVSARAPGEGAFRVYTPSGVVVTTGTVYGVGVAASGEARVGVETGSVAVLGLADLAAEPVTIETGHAATFEASGSVEAPVAWTTDDWGTWRDEVDAQVEVATAFDAHASALADLETQLTATYADLEATADSTATFEANAAASAEAGDTAKYEAALPEGAATIDASFAVAGRAEALTWAYAGHAALATDIYVRNPQPIEAKWTAVLPRVDAAVLWPKRFEVTATGYLEPLRMQYYVHHPRGRVNASLVGIAVPEFYAKVEPPAVEPATVRGKIKTKVWVAPEMRYRASARPVYVAAPAANWRAKARFSVAPPRAKVAWYVRPATFKSKVMLGTDAKAKYATNLKVAAPSPRASLRAAWKVPVGMKVKIGAPDFDLAARSRAKIKLDANGRLDANAHRGVVVRNGADAAADVRGRADVKVPDVRGRVDVKVPDVKMPDVRGQVGGGVKIGGKAAGQAGGAANGAAGGAAKAGADVRGNVKVPDVKVKVKAPEVKMKGEAKGGFKIGG